MVEALCGRFRAAGKTKAMCSGNNPINLDWIIPGTPGHDHNNAPGMDMGSQGYPFLTKNGFADTYREVAMYLNLAEYRAPDDLAARQEKLLEEGIYTGRYNVSLGYEFDGMCDRVGEYWRKVLEETNKPHPRPILAATHGGASWAMAQDKQPAVGRFKHLYRPFV